MDLDTTGFYYHKWSAEQRCKPGDWLVDNSGDICTIDAGVFARTYRRVSPGCYVKTTPVWVQRADSTGIIKTREGESHYAVGDFLVCNNDDGTDGYCMSAKSFHVMYEVDEYGSS
ncbi:MAG: hypothetical protein ABW168_25085 [Sedimenticola sp.]